MQRIDIDGDRVSAFKRFEDGQMSLLRITEKAAYFTDARIKAPYLEGKRSCTQKSMLVFVKSRENLILLNPVSKAVLLPKITVVESVQVP